MPKMKMKKAPVRKGSEKAGKNEKHSSTGADVALNKAQTGTLTSSVGDQPQSGSSWTTLYHATDGFVKPAYHTEDLISKWSAHSIIEQKKFWPGNAGFLGPGIYFTRNPWTAVQYCKPRGRGRVVVLRCRVLLNQGRLAKRGECPAQYGPGWWAPWSSVPDCACDHFVEWGREDCVMMPVDDGTQIDWVATEIMYKPPAQ